MTIATVVEPASAIEIPEIKSDESEVFSIHGLGKKLDSAADVAVMIEQINRMDKLKKFIISGNTIGVEAAQAFASAIKDRHEIEYVDLSDGFTGRLKDQVPKAMSLFGEALMEKQNLKYLNVSDNALGPPGAQALHEFLSQAKSLNTLYMTNNGLGMMGAKFISEALENLGNSGGALSTFTIGRNRLENEGAVLISRAIIAHAWNLKEFHIPQNGIRSAGIIALSKALGQCPHLISLDMQDNTFTLEGSREFSSVLSSWTQLRNLNLNDAYLTSRGAAMILDAFKNMADKSKDKRICLEYLQLQYNGIKSGELLTLIGILPLFSNIKSLHLNGNSFDPDGQLVEQLRETLIRQEKEDILDSLSDMELDEEESEEESSRDDVESDSEHKIGSAGSILSFSLINTESDKKAQEEASERFEQLVCMMEAAEIKTDTTSKSTIEDIE